MKLCRALGCGFLSAVLIMGTGSTGFSQTAQASEILGFLQHLSENSLNDGDALEGTATKDIGTEAGTETQTVSEGTGAETQTASEEGGAVLSSGTIECGGFDTPDEAIMAFADALIAGDMNQMLSTFAVESFCEHFSLTDHIQRVNSFMPDFFYGYAVFALSANDLMLQMSVQSRIADLMHSIRMPLINIAADKMTLKGDEFYQEVADTIHDRKFFPADGLSRSQIQDALTALQDIPDFSGMTVSGPVSMGAFSLIEDNYLARPILGNMFSQALVAGADGYTERGVILDDEDGVFLISMSIIRYGEKWYNYKLGGTFNNIMNISADRQGIMGVDLSMSGEGYDVGEVDIQDFQGIKNLLIVSSVSDSVMLQQIWEESAAEFDQEHEEFVAQLQSGRDADDNLLDISPIDFSKPLIEQMDALKTVADNSGQNFYTSKLRDLSVMSFDELLDFFAMQ